jgi:hypothetical protein
MGKNFDELLTKSKDYSIARLPYLGVVRSGLAQSICDRRGRGGQAGSICRGEFEHIAAPGGLPPERQIR